MAHIQRVQEWPNPSTSRSPHNPLIPKGEESEDSPPSSPISRYVSEDDTISDLSDNESAAPAQPPAVSRPEHQQTSDDPPPYSREPMRLAVPEPNMGSAYAPRSPPDVFVSAPTPVDGERTALLPRRVVLHRKKRRRRRSLCVRLLKIICAVALFLVVVGLCVVAGLLGHWSKTHGDHDGPHAEDPPFVDPDGLLIPKPVCAEAQEVRRLDTLTWNSRDAFRIKERLPFDIEKLPGDSQGRVLFLPGHVDQEDDFKMDILLQSTKKDILDVFFVNRNRTGFEFGFSDVSSEHGWWDACTVVLINIFVAKRVRLSSLQVSTVTHSIELAPRLHLALDQIVSLDTTLGSIAASVGDRFSARKIVVHTLDGSITGTWPLYDSLIVETLSGPVGITVAPHEADRTAPSPADLVARSGSGVVNVTLPSTNIPHRNFTTSVSTISGDVVSKLIHGSNTRISTIGGDINAVLQPFLATDSTLETSSQTGDTKLTVESPFEPELKGWSSIHQSISGKLLVTYPVEWNGTINAQTLAGDLSVAGHDVRITKDTKLGPLRALEAQRGLDEKNRVGFQTTSGKVDAWFS